MTNPPSFGMPWRDPQPDSVIARACDADARRTRPAATTEYLIVDVDGVYLNAAVIDALRAEREPNLLALIREREGRR